MGIIALIVIAIIGIVTGIVMYENDVKISACISVAVGCIVAGIILGSITIVPTGHTGILTTFGHVEDGTLDAGLHLVAFWKSVKTMDNRTLVDTRELSCFSSDIQEVNMTYSVNYQISKENAQNIYKTIGMDYLETVMVPKIQESVKSITAKYTAETLISMRNDLSSQIEEILRESLKQYNIEVVATSIQNIDFTDAFTNAVEAKQVAEQNKLKAQTEQAQKNLEAEAEAQRQVIKAQADADAAILAAKADAEVQQIGADAAEYSGKKEAAILSNIGEQMKNYPGLEKYYYYQKWNGILPVTMMTSGNTDLLVNIPIDEAVPTSTPAPQDSSQE